MHHVADATALILLATAFVAFEAIWPAVQWEASGEATAALRRTFDRRRASAQNLKPLGPIAAHGTLLDIGRNAVSSSLD